MDNESEHLTMDELYDAIRADAIVRYERERRDEEMLMLRKKLASAEATCGLALISLVLVIGMFAGYIWGGAR